MLRWGGWGCNHARARGGRSAGSVLWQWPRLALALLLCLSALGCGTAVDREAGEDPQQQTGAAGQNPEQQADGAPGEDAGQQANGASGGERDQQSNGASGAPKPPRDRRDDVEAAGAPIKIPRFLEDEGRPLDEVRAELESAIRELCGGGELCLTLRLEPRVTDLDSCTFVRTEPAQETEVPRGSTVVIVTGTQPCTPGSSGVGEPPPDDSGPPDEDPPPSTSDEDPPPPSTS
jgi:hypothetical protein